MAKINVEFDTIEKTLAVQMDGAEVADVVMVSLGKGYCCGDEDDFRCEIMTMTEDEASDVKTYTRLVASESADGKLPEAVELEGDNDFKAIIVRSNNVTADISKYFAVK